MNTERQRRLQAKKEFKKPVTKFESIDLTKASFIPKGMTRAFRNTRYTVMVYDSSPTDKGNAIRVMVQKHDNTPILKHWSEMQNIKNQIFGEEIVTTIKGEFSDLIIDRIKYVHELQNLYFVLTKRDLTIA